MASTRTASRSRVGASELTLGALLKHLAFVEDYYFSTALRGESPGPPWETVDWDAQPDWPFASAAGDSPEQLYALWDGAVERSHARLAAALEDGGLDQLVGETYAERAGQPAPDALRPGRGVRPAHRPRRPHPRVDRRTGRREPAAGLAPMRPRPPHTVFPSPNPTPKESV